MKNGELLRRAETAGFEILLTLDKGIEFEQNFEGRRIAVVIIRAHSNRLATILPMVPACLGVLAGIRPGEIVRVGS